MYTNRRLVDLLLQTRINRIHGPGLRVYRSPYHFATNRSRYTRITRHVRGTEAAQRRFRHTITQVVTRPVYNYQVGQVGVTVCPKLKLCVHEVGSHTMSPQPVYSSRRAIRPSYFLPRPLARSRRQGGPKPAGGIESKTYHVTRSEGVDR